MAENAVREALADAAGAVYLLCTPESDYVGAQTLVCGGVNT